MICFHFSIFESLETTEKHFLPLEKLLWFAFILVSLNHWKQHNLLQVCHQTVVICFHFSIFESLETTAVAASDKNGLLWFAFILVSLNHWKQQLPFVPVHLPVVICFHFSIFESLETTLFSSIMLSWSCDLLSF